MSAKKIFSHAPTRIDLAGGTVDIWPLYLFLKNPLTINLGIDLYAEALLEEKPSSGRGSVLLRSEDQAAELRLGWDELQHAQAPPQLELHLKFLRHFAGKKSGGTDLTLSTRARSPSGAGLGGSSTLSVAIIGAVGTWAHGRPVDPVQEGETFIEIVRDVETTVIRVPAGLQDYYGAMFGGLQALRWSPGSHQREWLPTDILKEMESRLMLFYSGQSRNSGINNWVLFKSFIDRDLEVQGKFSKINEATLKLEKALREKNWAQAGQAISEEWTTRKTLAPGITTSEIDQAFQIAARQFPGVSGKICGAGGGGCFFLYFPQPLEHHQRQSLEKDLQAIGVRHLPFQAVPKGLEIRDA